LCLALVVCASATAHARRKPKPTPPPEAQLFAINTHELFHLRPDRHGHFGKKELRGWNRFLRCHHTGRVHVMATRLASLLYDVDKHFEFKRVIVVAGYRAPRVAKEKGNPKSPHKLGHACDFRIEGVANAELRDYVRTLDRVGVGYYPNSDFVHLDVRDKHSAFWIDYSAPGERARYSKHPEQDLVVETTAAELEDEQASAADPLGGGNPQSAAAAGAPAPNPPSAPALTPSNP
jgi:uncharacterized protein YcbK (DUF882 family)